MALKCCAGFTPSTECSRRTDDCFPSKTCIIQRLDWCLGLAKRCHFLWVEAPIVSAIRQWQGWSLKGWLSAAGQWSSSQLLVPALPFHITKQFPFFGQTHWIWLLNLWGPAAVESTAEDCCCVFLCPFSASTTIKELPSPLCTPRSTAMGVLLWSQHWWCALWVHVPGFSPTKAGAGVLAKSSCIPSSCTLISHTTVLNPTEFHSRWK